MKPERFLIWHNLLCKDRLQNYLIFCFQNTQSFKGFLKQFRSSYFVTIPKLRQNYGMTLILMIRLIVWPAPAVSQTPAAPQAQDGLTGYLIISEAVVRHAGFPWVYEEQTMVLKDNRGQKNVRKLRQFYRVESDQTVKIQMVFDFPREVRGMTLTSIFKPTGDMENRIYLPALGKAILTGNDPGNQFLGTDFTIEDLMEPLNRYRYLRRDDQTIDKVSYFVVEAFEKEKERAYASERNSQYGSAYGMRRLFVRKDIFFIVRTDFFDKGGRMIKQLTRHDVKKTDQDMWQANMLFMDNRRLNHTTLIKTDQRILSRDMVPPEIFTKDWLDSYLHLRPEHRPEQDKPVEEKGTENDTGK